MRIDGLAGTFNFTVWQDMSVQENYLRAQLLQTFFVIAILTSSVVLIVWFGVGIGLGPLLDLQDAISIRSSSDLTPIRRPVPAEVKGIVATFNSLLFQVSESMQAKNVFISNAAHQLRNPIGGLMAMAEAVRSAPDAESALERTADLYESAEQVSNLANQLISFERANQAGSADFHKVLDIIQVVRSAVESVERSAPESVKIELKCETQALNVVGDALMLEEAIINLLDNALRYGGPDLTSITVDVHGSDDSVTVSVSDDGVGMTPSEMQTAMERFGQVSPGRGSGLGLSIVQSVASGHGGQFSMQELDRGLRAVMKLPRQRESVTRSGHVD
jgi:two-component system sensor histidine kinase TctE